jgi:hypothetical protein
MDGHWEVFFACKKFLIASAKTPAEQSANESLQDPLARVRMLSLGDPNTAMHYHMLVAMEVME